jgi:hypothetical protein
MTQVVNLKRQERARALLAAQNDWGLQEVLKRRRALIKSVPIESDEIGKLDRWLVTQTIPLKVLIDIWTRSMFCLRVMYGDQSPEVQHVMLVHLREHYVEFCQLPMKMQKKLWPFWQEWVEEVEGINGTA